MVDRDKLWIGLVTLVAWALGTAALVVGWNVAPVAGGVSNIRHVSEEAMVSVERLLTEMALFSRVAFVHWVTPPNHR